MLHKYKMLPLVAVMLVMSLVFSAQAAPVVPDFVPLVQSAGKAVVNISTEKKVMQRGGMPSEMFRGLPPEFERFFEQFEGNSRNAKPRTQRSLGTGFLISSDGYIVTNNHVVAGADTVLVNLQGSTGKEHSLKAQVIGTDEETDIALLKVKADAPLPFLNFGNSDKMEVGEWVLAIGNPFGLGHTVTAGILSAKGRNIQSGPFDNFLQTDASINPGNSGGALVNTRGELVGINTVIKSPTGSFAGYSFAVPTSIVKKVVVDLKEYGVVQRAMLGVTFQEINDAFIEQRGKETGINEKGGVYVVEVDPEGAAHAAGIRKGDVIIGIQELSIDNSSKLLEEIAKHRPNDKVTVKIKRGSDVKQMEVVLRNKSGNTGIVKSDVVAAIDALGGQFADISDRARKELKINGGVQVVAISGDGVLAQARIRTGYIITAINDRPVRSITDLNRITSKIESIDGIYPDGRAVSYSIVGK